MMKRAGLVHSSRTLAALLVLGLFTWLSIEGYGTLRASSLAESLRTANTSDVPALVQQMDGYRRWVNPLLKTLVQSADDKVGRDSTLSLALLPVDPSQLTFLEKRLLTPHPLNSP